jgi:hypothetical protein
LKEEQKELKSVVNGQILSRFPRLLMALKFELECKQEDNLIKVDDNVDEKKDKVLMQLSKLRPKSERIKRLVIYSGSRN